MPAGAFTMRSMSFPLPSDYLIRAVVRRTFASRPDGLRVYESPVGDVGLFGPDSVTWRVHADFPGMMSGGLSALLLQTLHPLALAGVWDHSNFRHDLLGRLRRTTAFVAATTYAPTAHARAEIERVRAIHERVAGTLPDGRRYSASDPALLGRRYVAPVGESVVHRGRDVVVTDIDLAADQPGFRFVHPILYANQPFGLIEVSISKAELEAAAATSRNLMIGLAAVILAVVAGISFTMARLMTLPLRRLKQGLRDAAMGDLDFRISHRRRDEFGELFDGFNRLATALQERLLAAERPAGRPRAVDATQIMPAPAPAREPAVRPAAEAQGTPFDPSWRASG